MSSSIVNLPTKISISSGMSKKRSAHGHHICSMNMNKVHHYHNPVAAFQCQYSRPAVSCRSHLDAATFVQESSAAVDFMGNEVERLPGGLRPELMPKHVAIIMDGHSRWAKERNLPTHEGHNAGRDSLKKLMLSACSKFRIEAFTIYAFSTENWKRSQAEIDFLMNGYEEFVRSHVMELIQRHELRFSMVGDKSRLPATLQSTISVAEESSKANKGMHFVMALSYSGRLDITQASKNIASKVEGGILRAGDINEDLLQQHLMTSLVEVPDVDLLLRTSGEMRVSNFLLWQLAYAEFYFFNKMFPDLDEADLLEAFTYFQGRNRRYGGRDSA